MRKVYLDNGSTSFPKAPGVGEAMCDYITNVGCNISRGGYDSAYKVEDIIFETRELICQLFNGSDERRVVFTPSVTYSINYIINGLVEEKDHIITSSMEHNAVARTCEYVKERGVEVSYCPCDEEGFIIFDEFEKLFKDNTKLVVICHCSNVSGTIQDIERVGQICKERDVLLIIDTAQSGGKISIDMQNSNIDCVCFTGHKGLLGPQGIGGILINERLEKIIRPTIFGGTGSMSHLLTMPDFFPDMLEPGTLNLPGIIGLNKSLNYIKEKGISYICDTEKELAKAFLDGVENIDSIRLVGPKEWNKRVGLVSLDFVELDNAQIAFSLDSEYGIMTRCGLHCAPLAHKTLRTYPQGTVRFTFGHYNTMDEVQYAIDSIKKILKQN